MELPITEVDICILKGQTFNQTLFWETGEPSTPVNLAGYTGSMEIKTHPKSPDNILILTTTNGRMVLNEQTGSIRLTLSANETSAVNVDEGVHRVYLTNGSVVTRIFQGKVYFNT
jgi:hypothetical protein